jgi:hypothetical protein
MSAWRTSARFMVLFIRDKTWHPCRAANLLGSFVSLLSQRLELSSAIKCRVPCMYAGNEAPLSLHAWVCMFGDGERKYSSYFGAMRSESTMAS